MRPASEFLNTGEIRPSIDDLGVIAMQQDFLYDINGLGHMR